MIMTKGKCKRVYEMWLEYEGIEGGSIIEAAFEAGWYWSKVSLHTTEFVLKKKE